MSEPLNTLLAMSDNLYLDQGITFMNLQHTELWQTKRTVMQSGCIWGTPSVETASQRLYMEFPDVSNLTFPYNS